MTESAFALGAARVYAAPESVPADRMESMLYDVGPTAGGLTLTFRPRALELRDEYGTLVRRIEDGSRVEIKGRLSRLSPRAAALLTGGRYDRDSRTGVPCAGAERTRILLTCPLSGDPDGEKLRVSLLAAPASAGFTLSPERDSALAFTLEAETDDTGLSGTLSFA